MSDPRVAIVGAGAVGSLIASALAHNGVPFIWCETTTQRLEQLADPRIEVGGNLVEITPGSVTPLEDTAGLPGDLDLLVIAVKSMHVAAILGAIEHNPANTLVIANGYQQGDFNLGLLYGGGTMSPEGTAELMPDNRLVCGALGETRRLESHSMLAAPWLQIALDADIEVRMFHKLALNCVINPLSVILDGPNALVGGTNHRELAMAILAEADRVARALFGERWIYSPASLLEDCLYLIDLTASNTSSMRADILAGREPEISTLNLAIVRLGAEYDLYCPCNEHMGSMISLLANSDTL